MFKAMLALHLLTAIFAIGPLCHAVTTAARGLRRADAMSVAESGRMTRLYAYASVLPVFFGFGLMSSKHPRTGKVVATFSDTYIWASSLLWIVAAVLALAVVAPALDDAADALREGRDASAARGKVSAVGGIIAVIFVVIILLMVYKP